MSVVSHGQGLLVSQLLDDLRIIDETGTIRVTLTLNIEETLPFDTEMFPFPIRVVKNSSPKGFGANHNAAFQQFQADAAYFCIVNPDIRIHEAIFDVLIQGIEQQKMVGVIAPLVRNSLGQVEDSARSLPTPWSILTKALDLHRNSSFFPELEYAKVDWVAGMFMLYSREVFARIGGFDERYFLYYEDVNICCRLHLAGFKVVLLSAVSVEHDAQRSSHRNRKYFLWHLGSMTRFFLSLAFLKCWWRKQVGSIE